MISYSKIIQTILIILIFLLIIPIVLFSVYLFDNNNVEESLIFNRNFNEYEHLNYINNIELCLYLNDNKLKSLLYCSNTTINYTIVTSNKTLDDKNKFYLYFNNYTSELNKVNGTLPDYDPEISNIDSVFSFELDSSFQFLSFMYPNKNNTAGIDISRNIISKFSPKLQIDLFDSGNFRNEIIGNTSFRSSRNSIDTNETLQLVKTSFQNYSDNLLMDTFSIEHFNFSKDSKKLNSSVSYQTTNFPINMGSNNSNISFFIEQNSTSRLSKVYIDKKNHNLIKYKFIIQRNITMDNSLFYEEYKKINETIENSTISRRLLLTNSTKFSFNIFSIKIMSLQFKLAISLTRDNNGKLSSALKIKIGPFDEKSVNYFEYEITKLDLNDDDTSTPIKKLFTKFEKMYQILNKLKPITISTPQIPIIGLPNNPFIKSNFFLMLVITASVEFDLERYNFFLELALEKDFTKDKYNETRLYKKDSIKDKDEIKKIIDEGPEKLFTSSKELNLGIYFVLEIKLILGVEVGASNTLEKPLSRKIPIKLNAQIEGTFFQGKLGVTLNYDFFKKKKSISPRYQFNSGPCKFIFTSQISSKINYQFEYLLLPSLKRNSDTEEILRYDFPNEYSPLEIENNELECPLSKVKYNDLLCENPNPCGCSLYPCLFNENIILGKKGIQDGCELGLPDINYEYIRFYSNKINCACPYAQVNIDNCALVKKDDEGFMIGSGFKLSNYELQRANASSEIKTLPSKFLYGGNITIANTSKNYLFSKSSLIFYNNLLIDEKLQLYKKWYNNRRFYSDIMSPVDNDFESLPRSIRTAIYLLMNLLENNQNDIYLMMLKYFCEKNFQNVINFYESNQNIDKDFIPILQLLKHSCNQCDMKKSSLNLEIIFILDGSGSISSDDFVKEKNFVLSFLKSVNLNKNLLFQAALIQFSSDSHIFSNFTDNIATLEIALGYELQMGWGTYTANAMILASQVFKDHNITNSTKIVFLITDGRSSNSLEEQKIASQLLQAVGANIIAIGVGFGISVDELKTFISSPDSYYTVENFDSINFLNNFIGDEICYSQNMNVNIEIGKTSTKIEIEGSSQIFFKIEIKTDKGKTIEVQGNNDKAQIEIYVSKTNPYPNRYIYDYKIDKYNEKSLLIIPAKSIDIYLNRILQETNNQKTDFFASLVYSSQNKTTIKLESTDYVNITLPCKANCLNCDNSSSICYECQEDYALYNGNCQSLNYTQNNSNFSKKTEKFEKEINRDHLHSLIFFVIMEIILLILLFVLFIFLLKTKKHPFTSVQPYSPDSPETANSPAKIS